MSSLKYFLKYGTPISGVKWEGPLMVKWEVPIHLRFGPIPKYIYCNKDLVTALKHGLQNIVDAGLQSQIKTWDGCFCIRAIRGFENRYNDLIKKGLFKEAAKYLSVHSYGMAFDIDRAFNQLGKTPQISHEVVECFTKVGFTWGGTFKRRDGMHFEFPVL